VSVSEFAPDGQPLSPGRTATSPGGFTQGGVSWPQGTVSDQRGNIWIANCGNSTVTRHAGGNPQAFTSLGDLGIDKPFDIAFNGRGQAFVTGNGNSAVAMLNPDGTPPGRRSPVAGWTTRWGSRPTSRATCGRQLGDRRHPVPQRHCQPHGNGLHHPDQQ
ncbi:MAG: hypothetical protein ACRDOH_23815, partial [Streptosporangiaceae bacterium]